MLKLLVVTQETKMEIINIIINININIPIEEVVEEVEIDSTIITVERDNTIIIIDSLLQQHHHHQVQPRECLDL